MDASSQFHTPDGVLSMHVDMVEIPSLGPRPDKSWTYTDEQGHEHFYDGYPVPYPTLVMVAEPSYYCADCRGEHHDDHLECRICGEVISPGLTGGGQFLERVPGRRSFFFDGEEITQDEFAELLALHLALHRSRAGE
jgi:hypothetical protein